MNKSTCNFVKGVGTGMVMGAAAVVAGKMAMNSKSNKRAFAKGTTKAFHAVGDFVEGIQSLMK